MDTTDRERFLPYGRQSISEADIQSVVEVLRSDWLTQGPAVPRFEERLREWTGTPHAVACANGTAALHLAMLALEIGPGDQVLTTPITFLASANCARYVGADVRFADVNAATGLMDPGATARALEADRDHRIKAIIPVHFAGQPVDLELFEQMAKDHGAALVDDACHALGAQIRRKGAWVPIGQRADGGLSVFSFHPVKHVTTGEGGAVTTSDERLAERLRVFRTHGIQKCDFQNQAMAMDPAGEVNPWYYEQQMLGFNYRLTDIQAALGASQMGMLSASIQKRNSLAVCYAQAIQSAFPEGGVQGLDQGPNIINAYHLYVARIDFARFGVTRGAVMQRLRAAGIGTQVHYIPVHLQPYYQTHSKTRLGDFPQAEAFYASALSLPMFPELTEADVHRVVEELARCLGALR